MEEFMIMEEEEAVVEVMVEEVMVEEVVVVAVMEVVVVVVEVVVVEEAVVVEVAVVAVEVVVEVDGIIKHKNIVYVLIHYSINKLVVLLSETVKF
jgi:hypothetical protein